MSCLLVCRRALNCLEALARGAEDRASLNVFPRWHDHGLESNKGGFNSSGQHGAPALLSMTLHNLLLGSCCILTCYIDASNALYWR